MAIFNYNIPTSFLESVGGGLDLVDLKEDYENIDSFPLMESDDEIMENSPYKPVFIVFVQGQHVWSKVISMWTDSKWSHAALCMYPSLSKMYTFNYKPGGDNGFATEHISLYQKNNPKIRIGVNAVLIKKDQWQAVRKNLNWYVSHKKETRYEFANLLRIAFGKIQKAGANVKMVCSQFVYTILQISNIDIGVTTDRPDNLVSPKDLSVSDKIYSIYEGACGEYNQSRATRVLAKVISKLGDGKDDKKEKSEEK